MEFRPRLSAIGLFNATPTRFNEL